MSKRIISFIIALCMLVSFAACGSDDNKEDATGNSTSDTTDNAAVQEGVKSDLPEYDLEELKQKYESLTKPEDVSTAEEYLEECDKFADYYIEIGDLAAEYPDDTELSKFDASLTFDLTEWLKKSRTMEDLLGTAGEKIKFLDEYDVILTKLQEATERQLEKSIGDKAD